ncbi:type II toxin-antitoxin system VapC family toxin [Collimonas antrihumi]|uniref:type II toxin-antitoxin system VapC family toxin n=1 Tax=Collimonas antrihumi TaxID=1940615 RepID=UPI001B8D2C28|nr:type II toxin-antitoxin system VapC family toxin [Collimonas antrihumi]
MRFVLDNSVTMRWLFGDGSPSDKAYAKQVLASISEARVSVPGVWSLEVANVITRAEKKFGLTEARSAEFVHALQQMHIQVDPETNTHALGDTLQLARRYNLSAYDAAYLELALREGLALATLDEGLIKAVKKAGAKRFISKSQ